MALLSKLLILVLILLSFFYFIRIIVFKTGLILIAKKLWSQMQDCFYLHQFFKVPQFNETSAQENQLYNRVSLYLNSLASLEDSDFTNLVTGKRPSDILLCLDSNQVIYDEFLGSRVSWTKQVKTEHEAGAFVLKVSKNDKRRILRLYLQHIYAVSEELELKSNKELKLFVNIDNKNWHPMPFNHPSTFDTIVMESGLKRKLKSDLESFVTAKEYYRRLGRVWKRNYLLYGPSGTGKSSFVTAMANFLGYNVYKIDLGRVESDSDLKLLFLQTKNKSVIVVEDLDRYLAEKSKAVSLTALLNFMDGILNMDERITVYTMTSRRNVDPILLRPGRVDVHIHFPLCDFSAFKTLANNYLGVKDHGLFHQIEQIFQSGSSMSPAEIGELMIANQSSPRRALESIITALKTDGARTGTISLRPKTSDDNGTKVSPQVKLTEDTMLTSKTFEGALRMECSGSGILSKESIHSMKHIKKLYGFSRFKSDKKLELQKLS